MNKNTLLKGIFFAFVTSVISGVAIFYSKISLIKIDPLVLATARNTYVAIFFLLGFLLFNKFKELKKIKRSQLMPLMLIGIIGGGIPFFLFFTGLSMIGAQAGNIIHKSLFIWVAILSVIILKEKFNWIYLAGFLLIFLGNFLFAKAGLHFGLGEGLVLTATLLWSLENIIAKKILRNISSEVVGLFRMGIGALMLISLSALTGKSSLILKLNANQLTYIVIGGTILSFYVYFWYKSLKSAPASLVTMILTFSVVVGNILNGAFAGIKIAEKDVLSSILITTGLMFVYLKIFAPFAHQFFKKDDN